MNFSAPDPRGLRSLFPTVSVIRKNRAGADIAIGIGIPAEVGIAMTGLLRICSSRQSFATPMQWPIWQDDAHEPGDRDVFQCL